VHAALARNTFRIAGQLADALLDETLDYSVRRRIPRLLATCDTHRAWDGLFEGLADGHFELRFRCSRGLEAMLHRHPSFRPDPEVIYRMVERELSASAEEWQSRQLGAPGEEEKPSTAAEAAVEDRASHALAHVFALLGLVLPRDTVRTAFRALHTDDRRLRALAVEYLGSSLPRQIRDQLCERIDLKPSAVRDSGARQMKKLMEESPSIAARLEEIGKREKGTGAG
jgi:hypothetical protein